jgi:hypothetical protein
VRGDAGGDFSQQPGISCHPHLFVVAVIFDSPHPFHFIAAPASETSTSRAMAQSTFSAKLQALQARDKELRESRQRQTDIETATAVTGTCSDMCPELERLFREETNQLSSLEMKYGTADPDALVKEYRRAGADQSEPLPHELRPGPVLSRTMDYLLCNVMDRISDESVRNEWYDFLWSRTRAIRKDITQQHLCDLNSTDLMEKCTRFHIHCAAALVEEDTTLFDPKINDENLRKCMQSLKDFYQDLSVSGIRCQNESEFRAYDILMNLGDSDILREIKHLNPDIRNSAAVKFAIDSYFALASNNYIQFFKLVKRTTYLNACLMHRFFNPIRMMAVRLLRRAFTTQKTAYAYPEDDFMRQLGFDDTKQVSILCENLSLQYERGCIILTREDYEDGAAGVTLPQMRSQSLVESKRQCSIGEVVNGGPLPPNPYQKHPVHSSFDEAGNLKPNALASVSPVKQPFQNFGASSIFGQPVTSAPKFSFTAGAEFAPTQSASSGFSFLRQSEQLSQPEIDQQREDRIRELKIAKVSDEFTTAVIDEAVADIVVSIIRRSYAEAKQQHDFEQQVQYVWERLVSESVDYRIRAIASAEYSEAREIQQAADLRRRVVETSRTTSDVIVAEAVESGIREIAARVWHNAQTELLKVMTEKIAGKVVENAVQKGLTNLIQSVFEEESAKQEKLVQQNIARRKLKICHKYWRIWLTNYRKNKKQRRFKHEMAASPYESSVEFVIQMPPPQSAKRPASVRTPSFKRKRQKAPVESLPSLTPSPTPTPTYQLRRSASSDTLAQCREQIRMASDMSEAGKTNLLIHKVREETERGRRNDELLATVSRALVHTEESYV